MRHLDLFSGIGGFALAASWVWPDHAPVAFCEIDKYCQKVLAKHWPNVTIHEDIHRLDGTTYSGAVDIVTAGFPCQDISVSGRGEGISGERSGLWSECFRVLRESRARWIVLENSSALLFRGIDTVLRDLAALGYNAQWHCIPASAVGAPHQRDRCWIVANADAEHGKAWLGNLRIGPQALQRSRERNRNGVWLQATRPAPGVVDGVSDRVDYRQRVEGVGNAIVPQVAAVIFEAIKAADEVTA